VELLRYEIQDRRPVVWYACHLALDEVICSRTLGIPKIFHSRTLATQVVSSTPNEIIFKLRQEYSPRGLRFSKTVNSLVSLSLDEQGKVKYHKDMWNEKDYSHEGLGKLMKELNGDHLTKITRPPEELKSDAEN
jgi:hypothetical protein